MPMAVGVPASFYPDSPQWRFLVRFMLKLKFSDQPGEGPTRYTDRPTTDEAVDAAVRWLRLHRNALPAFHRRYDTWEVLIPNEEAGFQCVASGTAIN